MSGNWTVVELQSLIDPARGISYGIVQPGKPVPDGVPIVRVSDVRGGKINTATPLRVSREVEGGYARSRLRGGELLVTIVGTVGETAIVPDELIGWNVARAIAVLPIRAEVGAYWIKLALRSEAATGLLQSRLNTTVQATLNLRDLAQLPIQLPPPAERGRIASVLGALDDKIELNRRMNETLEAIARAIFKDWFVDFGPTRAKTEGREPYLAPDLWALFPDRLDDEGKPEGWPWLRLEDLAVLHRGSVTPLNEPARLFEHYSLPAFDSGQEPAADLGESIKSNKTTIPEGTVLLSKLNPEISRVWIPNAPGTAPQVASTEFLVLRPKAPVGRGLLYCLFRDDGFRQMAEGMVTGTSKSHQRISPPALMSREVIQGLPTAFEAFEKVTAAVLARALNNRQESHTLAQTRDLLLPKLMSGEIRVKDAEKLVEAVA